MREHDAARRRRRVSGARTRLRAEGIDPEGVPWSITPFDSALQVAVSDEALSRFGAEFAELARAAGNEPPSDAAQAVAPAVGGASAPAVFAAGCAACRGRCCRRGRDRTAFLTADTLRRVIASRGLDEAPSDLLPLYLAHIGPTHAEKSCLFHGEEGCRLPRDLRSDTCNRWMCGDLRGLLDAAGTFDPVPEGHRFVAVTHDGHTVGGVTRYSSRAKAASKAEADGGKSSRRT